MGAGIQAVTDSGSTSRRKTGARCGAIMGSGIGGPAGIEDEAINWEKTHNPKKTLAVLHPSTIGNMVAGHLSIRYGLRGRTSAW
jgi:3-oxoacyl-[acyl-carrier-protein] synthase II